MKRINIFLHDPLRSDVAIVFCALFMSFLISIGNVNFFSDPYWIVRLSLLILPSIYLMVAFFSTRNRLIQDIEELQDVILEKELAIDETEERANEAEMILKGDKSAKRKTIPLFLKADVIKRAKRHCEYCGRMGDGVKDPDGKAWHIDHVVSVSRGGMTHKDNLVLACRSCNLRKKNKPVYQFVQELIVSERGGK